MGGQREMKCAPFQGRKGDSEFGRRTRPPDFRGRVRWRQPVQGPECLGKSLSDWGD